MKIVIRKYGLANWFVNQVNKSHNIIRILGIDGDWHENPSSDKTRFESREEAETALKKWFNSQSDEVFAEYIATRLKDNS